MTKSLTELMIKQAVPKDKIYSLSDGRGLYLMIHTNGSKYWFFRIKKDGKDYRKTLGQWPDVGLKQARDLAVKAKDTIIQEELEKASTHLFRDVYEEWYSLRIKPVYKSKQVETMKYRGDKYFFPTLGDMDVSKITPADILKICREVEAKGFLDLAGRLRQTLSSMFRFAMAAGYTTTDPTIALKGALKAKPIRHLASITNECEIADLMKKIDAYPGTVVRGAMWFSALVFCRPGEIRKAEWNEIDFSNAEWRIPAEKMKMNRVHIVPLATQTVKLLTDIQQLTGREKWVFPSARRDGRPMSENAVRVTLRAMGYTNDEMTAHGFRSMASTRLNEMGYRPDIIERQLAHVERNSVRDAYNRAEYLPERRKMMQEWADYLEKLVNS